MSVSFFKWQFFLKFQENNQFRICDNAPSAKIILCGFLCPVKSTKFLDFTAVMDNVPDVWFLSNQAIVFHPFVMVITTPNFLQF